MHASSLRQSSPATKHKLSPVLDHSAAHPEVIDVLVVPVSQGACLQQSTGVSISGWDIKSPGDIIIIEDDTVAWMHTEERPMHTHTHTHPSKLDIMGRSGQENDCNIQNIPVTAL